MSNIKTMPDIEVGDFLLSSSSSSAFSGSGFGGGEDAVLVRITGNSAVSCFFRGFRFLCVLSGRGGRTVISSGSGAGIGSGADSGSGTGMGAGSGVSTVWAG